MAKGRRLTTSHSERYLGSYELNPGQQTVNGAPEFGEDEVWSTGHGCEDPVSRGEWAPREGSNGGAGGFVDIPYPAAAPRRRPPRRSSDANHRHVGGLSLAFDDGAADSGGAASPGIVHQFRPSSPRGRVMATSAPVNVPDWSRIYPDDEEGSPEIVPPHEYLARSRRTSTSSVFEGAGRTLKGRDLSRVRDAVWSQTGFYG